MTEVNIIITVFLSIILICVIVLIIGQTKTNKTYNNNHFIEYDVNIYDDDTVIF